VIFFRDQDLTLEQHKAFGRLFGQLHVHPSASGPEGHPEILRIHALVVALTPDGERAVSRADDSSARVCPYFKHAKMAIA